MNGHPRMIKEAARMILAAERPVLYVGGGMLKREPPKFCESSQR